MFLFKINKKDNNSNNKASNNNTFKISEKLVRDISNSKNEPQWMLEKRLSACKIFNDKQMPTWGPDLSGLDLHKIKYFHNPDIEEKSSWDDVPSDIKDTFDKLGIPEAEHKYLGGVGAQYDSGIIYHKIKDNLAKQGVVFENMDVAVHKYPELVQEYFMSNCVRSDEHKFAAMHAALWSGGTFIYIPSGVKVNMPLQAYFRMNEPSLGQFEHTLIIVEEAGYVEYMEGCSAPKYTSSSLHAGCVEVIVKNNAKAKYISIENWSKNTYNLNTKKAMVYDNGEMNWINGNMGSAVTMLYPSTVLIGDNSKNESLGIVFAGDGQNQDTGNKVIHIGKNTKSIIRSKSISKGNGISNYRGFVEIASSADNAISSVSCSSLLIDENSVANTIPTNVIKNNSATISHEARAGRIDNKELFYLSLFGYEEADAIRLIVGGFAGDIIHSLPIEYAVEFNRLVQLEMK